MQNSVTSEQLDQLITNSEIQYFRAFETTTVCVVKLPNGFTVMGYSACVDPANFDAKIGKEIALDMVKERLWELEGYALKSKLIATVKE